MYVLPCCFLSYLTLNANLCANTFLEVSLLFPSSYFAMQYSQITMPDTRGVSLLSPPSDSAIAMWADPYARRAWC